MKTINKKTKTTSMMIIAVALIGTFSIGGQQAFADVIDFESGTEPLSVGTIITSTNTVNIKVDSTGNPDFTTLPNAIFIDAGDPRYGFGTLVPASDVVTGQSGTISVSNNFEQSTDLGDWSVDDYIILFGGPVSNLSLDVYDWGDDLGNGINDASTLTLEVYSDAAATVLVGSDSVLKAAGGDDTIINLSVPAPSDTILSARLIDSETAPDGDRGTAIDNVTFDTEFTKTLNECDPEVFIQKHTESQTCSFTIYPGGDASGVSIHDTIPAEWEVSNVSDLEALGCTVESSNAGTPDPKLKKANRSATEIWCPVDMGPITVELETRESPGKGHKDDAFKPTFCGILYLNEGALLLDENEVILETTNSLWVLVSENGDSSSDCDDDGLTDLQEITGSENDAFGNEPTDPANPDSDGDGLLDGQETSGSENGAFGNESTNPNDADTDGDTLSDGDEVNTFGSDPNTSNVIILNTTLMGSPGSNTVQFVHHESTFAEYGTGIPLTCDPLSGTVFVLDNGYINVSATSLLRDDCVVPTPTHDFVDATLHCFEGDFGPTSSAPLSTNGGAVTEGDFEITDNIGAIGTCTDATVFVESTSNFLYLAYGQ